MKIGTGQATRRHRAATRQARQTNGAGTAPGADPQPQAEILVIEHGHHNYTEAFRQLTEDYYLEQTFRRMTSPE